MRLAQALAAGLRQRRFSPVSVFLPNVLAFRVTGKPA
jgi:hypothetical protein